MEIVDSAKLRPRQCAIRGCMLTTHSKQQTLFLHISISLSSLLIRIKAKINHRCFGVVSNTLLTHVKVQIHTKDKQEPH